MFCFDISFCKTNFNQQEKRPTKLNVRTEKQKEETKKQVAEYGNASQTETNLGKCKNQSEVIVFFF